MTNGTANETMCLASNYNNQTTVLEQGGKKFESIENMNELMDAIFLQAVLANKKSIYLDKDCFFFLIKKGVTHTDFVIGDMDHVEKESNQNANSHSETMHSAYSALKSFIEHNTVNPSLYLLTLKHKFRQIMKLHNLPFIYKEPGEQD